MSSNTIVYFPSLPKDGLSPLDIAALDRAAWQLVSPYFPHRRRPPPQHPSPCVGSHERTPCRILSSPSQEREVV